MLNILLFLFCSSFSVHALPRAISDHEAFNIIKVVDDKQRNSGDYKANCYIKETEREKEPRVYQSVVYRRDADDKFMILFIKPKEEAGKGYLKIDKNLWMYDPGTGKWDRRTEREKIAGTNSRRSDFDESRLSEEYDVKFNSIDKLGSYDAYKIDLVVKKGVDVAYPRIVMWVDAKDNNLLKRDEYALSGKLMRTTFYPKWAKKYSPSKGTDVWVPQEMRIFDKLEIGTSTIILIKEVDLNSLPANIFTKAWLESKSR